MGLSRRASVTSVGVTLLASPCGRGDDKEAGAESGETLDVGEEMIRAGWADVFVFDQDFQRLPRYRAARSEARDADGVWGRCDGDFHQTHADELRERLVTRPSSWGTVSRDLVARAATSGRVAILVI
jgi:hypothetical protein